MRKRIFVAAASAAVIVVIAVSLGVSNTGLFHLAGQPEEYSFWEDDSGTKWDFVGNVSVRNGNVSRLGP